MRREKETQRVGTIIQTEARYSARVNYVTHEKNKLSSKKKIKHP